MLHFLNFVLLNLLIVRVQTVLKVLIEQNSQNWA